MTTLRRLTLLALAFALTVAFAVPAASSAATLEQRRGAGLSGGDAYIVYRAAKKERNRLTVTDFKGTDLVVFNDPGAKMRFKKGSGKGCKLTRKRHRATCKLESPAPVELYMGDRNDSVKFKGANAGKLGPRARTEVTDAAKLAEDYRDNEGAALEHALIMGGTGNDTITGTDSFDTIDGGPGKDTVDAGQGIDRLVDKPDGAPDTLFGGRGIDQVDVVGPTAVTVDLSLSTVVAGAETDTLGSVEKARGGAGDDTLVGTEGSDGLFGDHGNDKIEGRGGPDYLGSDLLAADRSESGKQGVDALNGGSGDDVLDARNENDVVTPTDTLACGDGSGDRIIALGDDLVDGTCENSAFGVFNGDPIENPRIGFGGTLSKVNPVSRGSDRAPTYAITCTKLFDDSDQPCTGRIQLELPPDEATQPDSVLGQGAFNIPAGVTATVQTGLNDAGKLVLAQKGQRVSVTVLAGTEAVEGGEGEAVRFGWQQVLGP